MSSSESNLSTINLESLILVTGLSGAGRSSAQRVLSDLGYYAVDNLPLEFFRDFLNFVDKTPRFQKVALHVDLATAKDRDLFLDVYDQLKPSGIVTLLFLGCDTKSILQRYNESRRPHPGFDPDLDKTLEDTITRERLRYTPIGERAHLRIDSSSLNIHELKEKITRFIDTLNTSTRTKLRVNFLSFGFKYGLPRTCDLAIDVRFLTNPYFVEHLRSNTGLDSDVRDFVLNQDAAKEFIQHYGTLLNFLIPRYKAEGKAYINIGIGCTGGKHRSVAMAEKLATFIDPEEVLVSTEHRDIDR